MKPKIVIVGYPNFAELARKVLQTVEVPNWMEIEVTELPLQILSKHSRKTNAYLQTLYNHEESTILISGDRSALLLAKELRNLIVPVKISGFDLLEAIQKTQSKEIHLLNFHQNLEQVDNIADTLNVKIQQTVFDSRKQAINILEEFQDRGIKEVIGGSWIAMVAQTYGMKGSFYYSHRSISEAIHYAMNVLRAYQSKLEQFTLFKTIIDTNRNGIITTDENLTVTVASRSVEKMIRQKVGDIRGRNIKNILPNLPIDETTSTNLPQRHLLFEHNFQSMMADIVPVNLHGEMLGHIISIDEVTNLQETEMKIRKKINEKSLKANYNFQQIIGVSPAIKETIKEANQFAKTESTILIQGESGTGKELIAQSIHNASNRRNQSFVAINCAALPENLLNSELFGYEEGSFTGAKKGGKPGLFELAHCGTIFLDEISELPIHLQSRLLRVIQEKEVMRIGGDKVIPVDVRIIAATNRDLLESVYENQFREDLYYRINVLQVTVPPLRERMEDIPVLLDYFLIDEPFLSNLYHGIHSKEFIGLLHSYDWPGNVREFENIMERFKAFCYGEKLSQKTLLSLMEKALYPTPYYSKNSLPQKKENLLITEAETKLIIQAIDKCNGNKVEAARMLGISRTTLWRKLKEIEQYKRN